MSSESGINSTRIVDDPTDPCYLHHGDSPSSVLVSQPLIGENYNAWRRSMMIALVVKNKLGFIDGSVSKPPSTDAKYALWIRCDMMVLSWIINSLSKDIANSVMYIDSAKELWDELKERFSESNGPRIFQLQRAISSLAQGQMSVSLYFTKLKGYWDELINFKPQPVCKCNPACSCGVIKGLMDYQQQEQIMQFLNGLNEVFAQTREQILLLEPLPTLNKVYAMVLAQERLKRISLAAVDVDAEATALLSKTYSGKQGYQRRDKPICSHCGMTGLVIDKCYKLHGYHCGYKSNRPRRKSGMANQVSGMDSEMPSVTDDSSTMTQLPFTKEQCEQLIQLLKIHGGQQTTHQANEISAVPHSSDSLMSASGELSLKTDMDAAKQVPHLQPELSKDEVKSKLESSLIGGLAVEISTAETSGSQPNFSNIGNPPPNMKLNAEPEKPSTIRVLFPTAPPTSGSGAGEKNEGLDVAVPEEDKVEELSERVLNQMAVLSVESPVKRQNVKKELFETIGIPYNASLSFPDEPEVSYNPTPPNSNPFGAPFSNATPTQVTSAFNTTIPSGELFRPASFNFLSPQSAQPSPPTNSGAFSGGFGAATTPQAPSQIGFGQRAQIVSGQQALGSVLGAFGQSRRLGTGLSGSGFVSPSGVGGGNNSTGGFSSPAPSGGFAGVASTVGGFAGLASGGGGFAGVASAGGGYSGPASSGGFAGAASSGGFPVAGGFGAFSSQ